LVLDDRLRDIIRDAHLAIDAVQSGATTDVDEAVGRYDAAMVKFLGALDAVGDRIRTLYKAR
jgi:hypothetical protein